MSWQSWTLQTQLCRHKVHRAERSATRRKAQYFLSRWQRGQSDETAFHTLPMAEWSSLLSYVADLEANRDSQSAPSNWDAQELKGERELKGMQQDELVELTIHLQAENKKLAAKLASMAGRPEGNPAGQAACIYDEYGECLT